jgi:hypothetical protein
MSVLCTTHCVQVLAVRSIVLGDDLRISTISIVTKSPLCADQSPLHPIAEDVDVGPLADRKLSVVTYNDPSCSKARHDLVRHTRTVEFVIAGRLVSTTLNNGYAQCYTR